MNLCNHKKGAFMDKKIKAISKKISKDSKSEAKEMKSLAHMDKKRDKVCAMGEKMMHKKGKK